MKKISMKKIFFLFFIILLSINFSDARNIYEKELPNNFNKECFKFAVDYNFSSKNDWKYKIKVNKDWVIAVKWNYLIPIISYKRNKEFFKYSNNLFENNVFLNDNNLKTYLKLDTEKNTKILLKFEKKVSNNSFHFNFKHSSKLYYPTIFISNDGLKFSSVSFSKIWDFDFKYLKIIFNPKDDNIKREIIKINELSIFKVENIKLIKVDWWWKVSFYSDYHCKDYINTDTIWVPFWIDINTKTVEINLSKNKNYNPNIEWDLDLDKIINSYDNCPKIYNPLQKDSNGDGVWNKCSDIDWDWILWHLDNCPEIKNANQKDINWNNIWDKCEFDKDKDWIFDSFDNCINIKNPFQKDKDKDWIWDKCDNCIYYNPKQLDKNNNNIWDICEEKKKFLLKNDKDKDGIMDFNDNCVNISNINQLDWDKDGVWNKCDNCLWIKNKNQLDFDKNWVWDLCEDSDKDWIKWIEDNCVNLFNKDQKDSDNNGIWDICEDKDKDEIWFVLDNCPYKYNPFQKDLDNDWIWDKCDDEDNRLIESNKTFFIIMIIIVVIWFWAWIFWMINKLNDINNQKTKKYKNKKNKENKENKEFNFLNGDSYTKYKK